MTSDCIAFLKIKSQNFQSFGTIEQLGLAPVVYPFVNSISCTYVTCFLTMDSEVSRMVETDMPNWSATCLGTKMTSKRC